MSKTRNNHFVPQWYQKRFLIEGKKTLAYLDMSPPVYPQKDGSTKEGRSMFRAPTSRAFVKRDLYSTFFGTSVNDEIERKLFGNIDTSGAEAVRAFSGSNEGEWISNFLNFFEYIDTQKLRTPKGLEWLKEQYPELSQNELMFEMQSIRFLNCTIWTTGVREIVSAEHAGVKFIITDHPVTVYNYASLQNGAPSSQRHDPSIALKGSQTIFPLGPDHCLILTNLEYAKDTKTNPLENRTFARNFRQTMVSAIDLIRSRELNDLEVTEINFILKARAQRFVAAGREEWLYPERSVQKPWGDLRQTLLPPEHELFRFGGEIFARREDGGVHYQDEFGRTEKPRDFLQKETRVSSLKPRDACGCGSGRSFRVCCRQIPKKLRPSWDERGIRERNMMLYNGLSNLFDLGSKDWAQVRREMTDEKIATAYRLYEGLWPLETDLLSLLPKPDGRLRSVYTGSLHPQHIHEFALGSSLYFGEILIRHPFMHSGVLNKEYRPTDHPRQYRVEFVNTLYFFLSVMPFVEAGLINLVPDPCDFDFHLREQIMAIAKARYGDHKLNASTDPRLQELQRDLHMHMLLTLPDGALRKELERVALPDTSIGIDEIIENLDWVRESDPFVSLQEDTLGPGAKGQLQYFKLEPNFEVAMYLAQATGSQILTDSIIRWKDLEAALMRRHLGSSPALTPLKEAIQSLPIAFPVEFDGIFAMHDTAEFSEIRSVFQSAFKYLKRLEKDGEKQNFEAQLAARFSRHVTSAQRCLHEPGIPLSMGRLHALMPVKGIQDNSINRLLLMSNSEHHLPSVPMAMFIDRESL